MDAFPTIDGKNINDPSSGYDPLKPYANRDPRLSYTVFYNGALWLNRPVETFDGGLDKPGGAVQQTKTGYYMRKFMGNFETVNGSAVYSSTVHDFIYFRYAEILLNYAEALNEFSGASGEVIDAVRQLRKELELMLAVMKAMAFLLHLHKVNYAV